MANPNLSLHLCCIWVEGKHICVKVCVLQPFVFALVVRTGSEG